MTGSPRSANGQTYTVLVCPHSGAACVDHDHHEPVPIECVPVARIAELERGRDHLAEQVRRFKEDRSVPIQVGEVTLWGSRDAVNKARWTLNHLKAKANGGAA